MIQQLGTLLMRMKRFPEAEKALNRAIVVERVWSASHPEDERSRRNLAVTLALLANALEGQKRYAEAHTTLDECERLRRWLMERPGALRRRVVRDLFALMERRVLVYRAEPDLDGEIEASKKVLPVVTELAELDPQFEIAIKQYADWIKRLERFRERKRRQEGGE